MPDAEDRKPSRPSRATEVAEEGTADTTSATTNDEEASNIAQQLLQQPTWSAKIRYLASQGFRNRSISLILSSLRGYPLSMQHVNNVLSNPLKSPEGRIKAEAAKAARDKANQKAQEEIHQKREAQREARLILQTLKLQQKQEAGKAARYNQQKHPQKPVESELSPMEQDLLQQARSNQQPVKKDPKP